jgi:hypothetical protein
LGCRLTSLFNNDVLENTAIPPADPAKTSSPQKRGWLPLLTVLFLFSYGLMTMLIVEQGQTIESQRALIRELFRDSTELSAVKQEIARNAAERRNAAQAPTAKSASPSAQIPSTQSPTKQIPSSQAAPQHQAQKQFQMPSRPASDINDENRALITI